MSDKASLAVLLCNLGTPEEPTPAGVRQFLKPFLSDPRVVEVPRPIWMLILHAFILPFRPKPVAEGYKGIWKEYGGSPLRKITQSQVEKLQQQMSENSVLVDYAFTYGTPGLVEQITHYRDKAERVLILPLYPQYSCSTTAAIYDQIGKYNLGQRDVADVYVIKDYYRQSLYRKALAESVDAFWQKHGRGDHLLMSYHGVPQAYADKGDPYYQQCLDTSTNLAADLALAEGEHTVSFQSRLGKAPWLQPYTDVTVRELAAKGVKTLDVICPSFSVDCLETLEEITEENGEYFTEAGGKTLRLIPCLNDSASHIDMMAAIIAPFVDVQATGQK
ncbi:Ferrochelatase [BD1-7 clade bacterium]|uniref:Ferrochelatase n=1 Tax=BD1-7 clade bacterium TaxID=2029982 RepID=A0A5S9N5F5_9GAMM|nr:Ferrochelatase [BD1-7 clade bacterium]